MIIDESLIFMLTQIIQFLVSSSSESWTKGAIHQTGKTGFTSIANVAIIAGNTGNVYKCCRVCWCKWKAANILCLLLL